MAWIIHGHVATLKILRFLLKTHCRRRGWWYHVPHSSGQCGSAMFILTICYLFSVMYLVCHFLLSRERCYLHPEEKDISRLLKKLVGHYSDVTWAFRHLKPPPETLLNVGKFDQANNKEFVKIVHCWPSQGDPPVTTRFPSQETDYVESVPFHDLIINWVEYEAITVCYHIIDISFLLRIPR